MTVDVTKVGMKARKEKHRSPVVGGIFSLNIFADWQIIRRVSRKKPPHRREHLLAWYLS